MEVNSFISARSGAPVLEIEFVKPRGADPLPLKEINVEDFIAVKGYKAMGNQLTDKKVKAIRLKDSLPYDIQPEVVIEEIKVNQPESLVAIQKLHKQNWIFRASINHHSIL